VVLRIVYVIDESGARWAFLALTVPEETGIDFELAPWHDVEAGFEGLVV